MRERVAGRDAPGRLVAGIFVGGASRRMGGGAKGLLLAPRANGDQEGEARVSILERTVALARACDAEVVLVGNAGPYESFGIPAVADATTAAGARAAGPLAGLVGLLELAPAATVIALACDMPYLTVPMLARLIEHAPDAIALAPREAGDHPAWSPLFARYHAPRVAALARAQLEAGERSLRAVLDAVDARELPLFLEERHALRDWDTPADVDDVAVSRGCE